MLRAIAKKARKPPDRRGSRSDCSPMDRGVSLDHLSKLEAALYELGECRRMLDAELADLPAFNGGAPLSASDRPELLPLFFNLRDEF